MGIEIKRGDILYADLGVKYQGSMQGGIHGWQLCCHAAIAAQPLKRLPKASGSGQ